MNGGMGILPFNTHGEFHFSPFSASPLMDKNPIPSSPKMRITSDTEITSYYLFQRFRDSSKKPDSKKHSLKHTYLVINLMTLSPVSKITMLDCISTQRYKYRDHSYSMSTLRGREGTPPRMARISD